VRNFQAAQKLSASRQRATAVPVPVLVDITEGATTQTQMQMQTQLVYATEDAFREAEIRDQRNALRELEAGVLDVADIMQSLAHIVEQQGEDLGKSRSCAFWLASCRLYLVACGSCLVSFVLSCLIES
jgi:hypothetical protein